MSPLVDTNQFEQRCYENTGRCIIGVVKLREHDGRPEGLPLRVGETVWLNEIEERLTKNAPTSAANNPFANGDLKLIDATSAQTAAEEVSTPVEPSPEPPVEQPEVEQRHPDAPDPNLPPGALPPGTPVPQVTAPEPVEEPETLDDAALAAAEAAKASGAAPTSDDVAPETVVEQIEEETAVEQHTAETGVAVAPQGEPEEGSFKEGEEVATPDAPAKVKDETGDKPNFAKKTRSK